MKTLPDMNRQSRLLKRDHERLELLLQMLTAEREESFDAAAQDVVDPTIRRVQDRLERVAEQLRVCDSEVGKRA